MEKSKSMKVLKKANSSKTVKVINMEGNKKTKNTKNTKNEKTIKNNKTTKANNKKKPSVEMVNGAYEVRISEPWFTLLKLGIKKAEGRLNQEPFSNLKKGDKIRFKNYDFNMDRQYEATVDSVKTYPTFKEYIEKETIERTLPGMDSANNGEKVYRKFYKENREKEYGVVGISF